MAEVEDEKHLWITTVRWLHVHNSEITPCPQLVNQCLDQQQLQMIRDYLTQQSLTECLFHFNQLEALPAETSHVADSPVHSMLPWVVMEPYRTHWRYDFPSFHFFQYLAWRWSWSPKTVHLRNCWQTDVSVKTPIGFCMEKSRVNPVQLRYAKTHPSWYSLYWPCHPDLLGAGGNYLNLLFTIKLSTGMCTIVSVDEEEKQCHEAFLLLIVSCSLQYPWNHGSQPTVFHWITNLRKDEDARAPFFESIL